MVEISYLGPFTKKGAFSGKESHPLLLDLLMIKEFGPDYLGWEADTCWQEILKTFGTNISETNKNKLQAVRTCHVSDRPYDAWNIFEKVAVAFSGATPLFGTLQKPSLHVCAAALETMSHIKDAKPSDEVYRYIAAIMLDDGVSFGPGILAPSNKYIEDRVGAALQKKVKKALEEGRLPKFDGSDVDDIQIYKSSSIADYVHYDSKKLLRQTGALFRKGDK
jgi:hypothetical protein